LRTGLDRQSSRPIDDAIRTYLVSSRLGRPILRSKESVRALARAVRMMRRYFEVDGIPIGDRCSFLALSSAQCQCEMLLGDAGDTMVLDAGLVDFLHAANSLAATSAPQSEGANFAIAAEQLGLAALHHRDYIAAINCKVAALSWGKEFDRLNWRSRDMRRLLDMQTTFLVLHEMYHWALDKSEALRRISDHLYNSGFQDHLCAAVRAQLSPEAVRKHAPQFDLTDEDIARHADLAEEAVRWVQSRQEELTCDFLALRVLMLDVRSPYLASRAVYAGATMNSILDVHASMVDLASGASPGNHAQRRRERAAQARYFVYAAMPGSVAIAGNSEVDSSIYQGLYTRYLENSIIPICAARDVLWTMQMDGELVPAGVKPEELDYCWRTAKNAFDIDDDGVPMRLI